MENNGKKFVDSVIRYFHSEKGITITWNNSFARVMRESDKKTLREAPYKEPNWEDPRVVSGMAKRLLTEEEHKLGATEGLRLIKKRAHLEWATEMFNRLKSEFLPE